MSEYLITIKGKSRIDGGEEDITELQAVGSLEKSEDGLTVTYDDSMSVGIKGVTARLKTFNS